MKRYYKATDGKITVFRSTVREYASASFSSFVDDKRGAISNSPISFSSRMLAGNHQAVAIDKAEFERLRKAKQARIEAAIVDRTAGFYDSWVRNADIAS